jgi:hypothetical protein
MEEDHREGMMLNNDGTGRGAVPVLVRWAAD